MKKWFGFTQDGAVIYLGEYEDIEDVDDTPRGSACIWLWDEVSLKHHLKVAESELKQGELK
jgi:hypothetical protein